MYYKQETETSFCMNKKEKSLKTFGNAPLIHLQFPACPALVLVLSRLTSNLCYDYWQFVSCGGKVFLVAFFSYRFSQDKSIMFFLTIIYDHQSLLVHIFTLSTCLYGHSKYIRSTHIQLLKRIEVKKSREETHQAMKASTVSSASSNFQSSVCKVSHHFCQKTISVLPKSNLSTFVIMKEVGTPYPPPKLYLTHCH